MIKKKAFTLLETLIVLGLVVTVIAAGAVSLTNARNSIELDNTYSDVLSAIRTTQNDARNYISIDSNYSVNIVPPVPDIYAFRVNTANNEFWTFACTGAGASTSCTLASRESVASSVSNITINSNCYAIGFRKGIRDIVSISQGGVVSDSGNCTITISQGNRTKNVIINLDANNISVN